MDKSHILLKLMCLLPAPQILLNVEGIVNTYGKVCQLQSTILPTNQPLN